MVNFIGGRCTRPPATHTQLLHHLCEINSNCSPCLFSQQVLVRGNFFCSFCRQLPMLCSKILSTAFVNGLVQLALWQVLPSFICDFAFYWMLFLAPYAAWNCFKACLTQVEGGNNVTKDVIMWLWRKAKLKLRQLRVQRHF